jgi:hypothetical protein
LPTTILLNWDLEGIFFYDERDSSVNEKRLGDALKSRYCLGMPPEETPIEQEIHGQDARRWLHPFVQGPGGRPAQ